MTPTYLNSSSPSPFPPAEYPNGLHQADNFDSHGGSYYDIGSTSDNRLKFSIWKKEEDKYENYHHPRHRLESTSTSTSSKMRLMHKMENNIDPTAVNPPPSATTVLIKLEDHQIKDQVLSSSPMKTDNSSNTANPSNNSTNPIRVCSDCNTTKTPLWRSGPQGPKSLCNACGIRQRKARRAMAEAAATDGTSLEIETTLGLKTKIKKEQKEKGPSNSTTGRHNVGKYKIRRRSKLITSTGPTSSSHDHHQGRINKLCFEDF